MSKKRMLWLATRWPEPANTGAKRATQTLVKYLFQEHDIYLGLTEKGEGQWNGSGQAVPITRSIPSFKKYFCLALAKIRHPFFPLSYLLYRQYQSALPSFIKQLEFELIVVDGLHSLALIPRSLFRGCRIIYRSHNVEANIWFQRYTKETNLLKKVIYFFEYHQMENLEQSLIKLAHLTLTVSEQDQQDYQKLSPYSQIQVLPIGFEFKPLNLKPLLQINKSNPLELLFVGRLDWYPNQEGLLWFLQEVWPHLNLDKFNLVIVGSGKADYLKPFLEQYKNLQFFSNLPSLDTVYANCDITIIPLFSGSGTRVKAIEAASLSRSFLSTELGVEGLNLDSNLHYVSLSEQAQDWIKAINQMNPQVCQSKAQEVYSYMREKYSALALAQRAQNLMQLI